MFNPSKQASVCSWTKIVTIDLEIHGPKTCEIFSQLERIRSPVKLT